MGEQKSAESSANQSGKRAASAPRRLKMRRRAKMSLTLLGIVALSGVGAAAWLYSLAATVHKELESASQLMSSLQDQVAQDDVSAANTTVDKIRIHTAAAKKAADDPWWTLASSVPWMGANFSAVAEISRSADDVANLGLAPLISAYESLDWNALVPTAKGANLESLKTASPNVVSAAHAVSASSDRLAQINERDLIPAIAEPLTKARDELAKATRTLSGAADVSRIAPSMLGSETSQRYLLMIQNSAEARASGGIPGALAVLTLDKGKMSLGAQSSAGDVGVMSPVIPVDPAQQRIFSGRMGKFFQDVNLTPDFPTAASTAQAMWERKSGQVVDGVISIDPVVLSYMLQATGPISIDVPEQSAPAVHTLPAQLTKENVVQTLLSDVYAAIEQPESQDAYFAAVAKEIFAALTHDKSDPKGLISGLTRGTEEGRVLVWSSNPLEQEVISRYSISGSISGPSVAPAQFGVYFNDGTGAKMDYYVKHTVQLIRECPADGYEQTTVRVTSSNTAPIDAGTFLPEYVTGGGAFGVPPGVVQTNVMAYGPAQAQVETAKVDGQKTAFAPYLHANRPVGVIAQRLAPGESKTVEFTFGKIVQHTEPDLFVTPTVQPVTDVVLPSKTATCG